MGARHYGLTDTDSLVTHGAVIRAVAEYAALALDGRGTLIIGDCPVQGTDWEQVVGLTGLSAIARHLRDRHRQLNVRIQDFRLGRARLSGERMVEREVDESRRNEYIEADLGRDSLLVPLMKDGVEFGVAQYPRHRMRRAHTPERNLYLFPREFLAADVVINVPKLKSHMKAGITCALKNFVGVNGHKDYLPHFRFGSPREGGDEYPDGNWLADLMWAFVHRDWELDGGPRKAAYFYAAGACSRALRHVYGYPKGYVALGGGSWYGNDTVWRTVLDINRAFLYWDRGAEAPAPNVRRRYFAIVDGLVGGHRESPLAPTPVEAGLVLCGANPAAVDLVATAFMGFDWRRIRQVERAFDLASFPLTTFTPDAVRITGLTGVSSVSDIYEASAYVPFEPSAGFRGHIEYDRLGVDAGAQPPDGLVRRLPEG